MEINLFANSSTVKSNDITKKKTYITHVTKDYLEVALNLAKSIRYFSELPLIVYCIDLDGDENYFKDIPNVEVRNINLDLKQYEGDQDYIFSGSGNFYVNRSSHRIYHILCAKTLAMELALEEGWDEVCYLDSDCLATPLVDELFDWSYLIQNYPVATEGIHQYMILIENGKERGNPFENTWPQAQIDFGMAFDEFYGDHRICQGNLSDNWYYAYEPILLAVY